MRPRDLPPTPTGQSTVPHGRSPRDVPVLTLEMELDRAPRDLPAVPWGTTKLPWVTERPVGNIHNSRGELPWGTYFFGKKVPWGTYTTPVGDSRGQHFNFGY